MLACILHLKIKCLYSKLPIISVLFEGLKLCCNYVLSCYPYQIILVGPSPASPLVMADGEAKKGEFDCAYPRSPPARCWASGKHQNTALGWENAVWSLYFLATGPPCPQPLLRTEILEVHRPSRRPGPGAPKLLDIHAPLSLQDLRGESEALAQGWGWG